MTGWTRDLADWFTHDACDVAAFDATGERLVVVGGDRVVTVDARSGALLDESTLAMEYTEDDAPGRPQVLAWSPDARRQFVALGYFSGAMGSNEVYLLDATRSGARAAPLDYPQDLPRVAFPECSAAAFYPDGQRVVALNNGQLLAWDLAGTSAPRIDLTDGATDTWCAPENSAVVFRGPERAAVVWRDAVYVVDLPRRAVVARVRRAGLPLAGLAAWRDDDTLVVIDRHVGEIAPTAWVIRPDEDRVEAGPTLPGVSLWIAPRGAAAITHAWDTGFARVDLDSGAREALRVPDLVALDEDSGCLAVSPDGARVAWRAPYERIAVFDLVPA